MKKFSSKFHEWVIVHGGGTRGLSEKLGVRQSAVQHWISRRNSPGLELAIKIARLGKGKITLHDILSGTQPK